MSRLTTNLLIAVGATACRSAGRPIPDHLSFRVDTVVSPSVVSMERPVAAYPIPGGRLAVADYGANQILVVDTAGRLIARLGRHGDGPGEFGQLLGVAVRGDTVAGLDVGNGRLVNFVGTGYISTRALPSGFSHQAFVLLPGDTSVHMTDGFDSSLAVARAPNGIVVARFGKPVSQPSAGLDLPTVKHALATGRIPDEIRNDVLPVVAVSTGDVWLIQQVSGVIEHYNRNGAFLGRVSIPAAFVRARLAESFRSNALLLGDPARLSPASVRSARSRPRASIRIPAVSIDC